MRTTLTLDDTLLGELKALALKRREPLRRIIDQALRAGLATLDGPRRARKFKVRTFSLGSPKVPNLDKALALATSLDQP